jgi:hypothetical protein
MIENFTPLFPSDSIAKNSTSSELPRPSGLFGATDQPFSPLSASLVDRPTGNHSHLSGGAGAKPSVTLQRDGDRVTQIRIQCVCGHVIELDCLY